MNLINILKYIILTLLVVSLLIYGYLMISNPRNERTLHDRHQYALGGIVMFYFYLPAIIYSYLTN